MIMISYTYLYWFRSHFSYVGFIDEMDVHILTSQVYNMSI